jgi:eukaryotic-like serine/threonine-protein kinase
VEAMTMFAGRYRILDRLGDGGMSVVWRAHDDVLDRDVAIKVLDPGQMVNGTVTAQIRAEARAAAAVCHPTVATVHDYGESADAFGQPVPYVVMELVNGPTLAEVLGDGPVAPGEAMRICADVAAGLAAVHAHGLVHRDVKPANVIVTSDGAKLVDFGIAHNRRAGRGRRERHHAGHAGLSRPGAA